MYALCAITSRQTAIFAGHLSFFQQSEGSFSFSTPTSTPDPSFTRSKNESEGFFPFFYTDPSLTQNASQPPPQPPQK